MYYMLIILICSQHQYAYSFESFVWVWRCWWKSVKDRSQCGTGSAAAGVGICVPLAPSAAGLRWGNFGHVSTVTRSPFFDVEECCFNLIRVKIYRPVASLQRWRLSPAHVLSFATCLRDAKNAEASDLWGHLAHDWPGCNATICEKINQYTSNFEILRNDCWTR